jgi:hypothetical protein
MKKIGIFFQFLKSLFFKNKNLIDYHVGNLFKVPDSEWDNDFASNRRDLGGLHPGLIREKNKDNFTYKIIPGTTKEYQKRCIFKTNLAHDKRTNFLLQKYMSVDNKKLNSFQAGWGNKNALDEHQLKDFKLDFKFCFGRDAQ